MDTKFTKGEWQISTLYNTVLDVNVNGLSICEIDCCGNFNEDTGVLSPTEEERANAHLIIAAPYMCNELLECLDTFKAIYAVSKSYGAMQSINRIEILLAKIRGEL
jgi:hypothetical protein